MGVKRRVVVLITLGVIVSVGIGAGVSWLYGGGAENWARQQLADSRERSAEGYARTNALKARRECMAPVDTWNRLRRRVAGEVRAVSTPRFPEITDPAVWFETDLRGTTCEVALRSHVDFTDMEGRETRRYFAATYTVRFHGRDQVSYGIPRVRYSDTPLR